MSRATVEVTVRSVYGVDKIYPANWSAEIFASLAGQKTLTGSDLNLIRELGYAVVEVPRRGALAT
jgi:hypothetical protein